MVKSIVFDWEGAKHTIEKVRFAKSEDFYLLLEQLGSEGPDARTKMEAVGGLLALLNCPQSVIDDLAMDEIGVVLEALQRAHFGLKQADDSGGADGPPAVAGNP